jgi:hypothetical protein
MMEMSDVSTLESTQSQEYQAWLAHGRELMANMPTESWDDRWITDDFYLSQPQAPAEAIVRGFF